MAAQQTDVQGDMSVYSDDSQGRRAVYTCGDVVVHHGLPYVCAAVDDDFEPYMAMYSAHEGTMLHAVHMGTEFTLGTNKRLSCENSRWASKRTTFKQTFEAALSRIYPLQEDVYDWFMRSKLDPHYSYVFLVMATEEERLVAPVDPTAPGALLLATCTAPGQFNYCDATQLLEFPRPHMVSVGSLDDVQAWLTAHPYCSGLVAHLSAERTVRFSLPQYTKMLKIRGNAANIKSRITELLHRPDDLFQLTAAFPHLYDYTLQSMAAYQRLVMTAVAIVMNYNMYMDHVHMDPDLMNRVYHALSTKRNVTVEVVRDVVAKCFAKVPMWRRCKLLNGIH